MTSQSPRHALVGWALTVLGVVGTGGLAGAAGAGSTAGGHAPPQLLVFAAASLSDALEEVDRAFTALTGVRVNASYAASSVLAKQIEAGAPADAFFSADLAWVDYLEERGLLKRGSRRDVLGNALVLIAPADFHALRVYSAGLGSPRFALTWYRRAHRALRSGALRDGAARSIAWDCSSHRRFVIEASTFP